MDLDALRALIAVVDTGSLVAAARVLKSPRATLRRRIEELEVRVGTPLLIRTTSGVVPTPAGELMVRSGTVLLQQAGALLAQARDAGHEATGTIRVLLSHGLPVEPLLMLVSRMKSAGRLNVDVHNVADPLAAPLGEYDFVLHFGTRIPDGPWLSYLLLRSEDRLLASPSYLQTHGEPRTVQDLQGHAVLMWRSPDHANDRLPMIGGGHWPVEPRVTSSDVVALRRMASMDLGLAFVPDPGLAIPGDPTGDLRPVLSGVVGRANALRLVVPAPLVELPRIRRAMEMLQEFLGELPAPERGLTATGEWS
jgi:DNA-binding transcriptional LysR family regulator